jgi:hypothetical protein
MSKESCSPLLLDSLGAMHAKESKAVIAEACLHGEIDDRVSRRYIAFHMQVGLPVDMNDPAASLEVNEPMLLSTSGRSKRCVVEGYFKTLKLLTRS